MKTQSSTLLSKSKGNGRLAMVSSLARYWKHRRKAEFNEGHLVLVKAWQQWQMETYLPQHAEPDKYELLLRRWHWVRKLIVLKEKKEMWQPAGCADYMMTISLTGSSRRSPVPASLWRRPDSLWFRDRSVRRGRTGGVCWVWTLLGWWWSSARGWPGRAWWGQLIIRRHTKKEKVIFIYTADSLLII